MNSVIIVNFKSNIYYDSFDLRSPQKVEGDSDFPAPEYEDDPSGMGEQAQHIAKRLLHLSFSEDYRVKSTVQAVSGE